MLRALFTGTARHRAAWLFGFICSTLPGVVFAALPIPAEGIPALRIQGSNTIGAALGPALVEGLLHAQGLQNVRIEAGAHENEQRVLGQTPAGRTVLIEVAAHGSGTGFTALKEIGRASCRERVS